MTTSDSGRFTCTRLHRNFHRSTTGSLTRRLSKLPRNVSSGLRCRCTIINSIVRSRAWYALRLAISVVPLISAAE